MRAGRLDRYIAIQNFTSTQNDFGEPVETWSTLASVWAERIPVSGREVFAGDQLAAAELVRYRIRYRSDVNARCRIVDNSITYNVRYIAEIGRREGLELVAEVFNP